MPDRKITDLVDGAPLQATDEFVVARAGDNFKIDGAEVVAAVTKHDVTLAGNTAGALALISSGTMTLAGGNNITVSQAGNAVTISGAAFPGDTQTAISGLANSETTYTSGSVTLSALGAITIRSTTGQHFQLSVNAQSIQPETQTFIGGISASDTLYTSGTVRFTGSQAVTVRSGTGQLVVIDVPTQSVQPETQTFVGGISASDTLYTSGTVRFTGVGGGVTVSSNTGQRVDISVAAQSVQPETQTFIGGISASDTLYTSGSVRFTGVGGGITVSSNTGQRVDLSVAAQSVQPETQTFVGGIGNSQTTYTSGTVNLSVVAGQLTIRSTTGQAFQFSASQSVQVETQTFLGALANSETTYTSGSVTLSALGAITVRSTTGQHFQLSVNSQTVQTQNAVDVTLSGNTAGVLALISSGTMTLAGGNNIILSQAGNAVTISASSQSVQAETQTFVAGIQNSQTTYTSGTVNLSVVAGNLTIRSTTGQAFQFSASQTVQAETQTFVGGIQNSETTYTSGTVNLSVVAGNLTIRSTTGQAYQFSASQTVQTQDVLSIGVSTGGNTAGNTTVNTGSRFVLVGSNGITASASTAAGATTVTLSGVTIPAAQTGISGISNSNTTYTSGTVGLSELGAITIRSTTGNQFQFSVNSQTVQTQNFVALSATNTLYSSGTVLLTGSNMITVKSSGAGQTIILDATQSVQTQGILNVALSNVGNTSGDTGINSGTRMVLAGGNNITLSASTAANATTITISAPNLGAGAFSGGASTGGNTAGATGITGTQLVFVGSGVVSLSQTTGAGGGTLSILAPATSSLSATGAVSISTNGSTISIGAPVATNFSAGLSTGGNTAGATGITGTRLVFVGTNNISLSQTTDANGGTISINNTASNYSAGISTGGNTAGSTGVTGTRLVLVGTNAVSLSQATDANGGTLSINVTQPVMSYSMPASHLLYGVTQGIGASAATQTTVTAFVMPMSVPAHLAFNNLFLAVSNNFSSATTSISSINYSYSQGASLGFYTLNDSTMSLVTSFSGSLGFTNATSANATDLKATGIAGWGGSSQSVVITGAANMSSIMSSISGARKQALNWSTNTVTLTANQYWAVACFTQLTGGNAQASLSSIGFVSSMSIMGSAWNPPAMMRSTASVTSPYPFLGQATLVNSSNSLMPISFNTNAITVSTATANSTKFQSIWFQMYRSHSD